MMVTTKMFPSHKYREHRWPSLLFSSGWNCELKMLVTVTSFFSQSWLAFQQNLFVMGAFYRKLNKLTMSLNSFKILDQARPHGHEGANISNTTDIFHYFAGLDVLMRIGGKGGKGNRHIDQFTVIFGRTWVVVGKICFWCFSTHKLWGTTVFPEPQYLYTSLGSSQNVELEVSYVRLFLQFFSTFHSKK